MSTVDPDGASQKSVSATRGRQGNLPAAGDHHLDFQILGELGRGSFSRVYLARQDSLASRFVVLKASRQRWAESDILARLQHANIVPIYSVHRQAGVQYVCMPFLGCVTLADVIRAAWHRHGGVADRQGGLFSHSSKTRLDASNSTGQLLLSTIGNHANETLTKSIPDPELVQRIRQEMAAAPNKSSFQKICNLTYDQTCLWLIAEVASGLAHAHEQNIVHRDLKPANILITDDGRPMLLDFNLSEAADGPSAGDDSVGGTLPYMAPEHLLAIAGNDAKPNQRSDIFSLGVLLCEMLTGARPFPDRQGPFERMVHELHQDRKTVFLPNHAALNGIEPAVRSIIAKCLAANPAHRYASANELRTDLLAHLDHQPLRFAPNISFRERTSKWFKRHPRLSSGATVALACSVLLMALVAVMLVRNQRLAALEAQQQFNHFASQFDELRVWGIALDTPDDLADRKLQAIADGLAAYHIPDDPNWRTRPEFRLLPKQQKQELLSHSQELTFVFGNSVLRRLYDGRENGASLFVQHALNLHHAANAAMTPSRAMRLQYQALMQANRGGVESGDSQEVVESDAASSPTEHSFADAYLMGLLELSKKRFSVARSHLERAVALQSKDIAARFALGNALHGLGEDQDALQAFSICIALDPKSPHAYVRRGIVYLQLKAWQQSQRDFEKALQLEPELTYAQTNLAISLMETEQWQACLELTNQMLAKRPDARMYLIRARARQVLGDMPGSRADVLAGQHTETTDVNGWVAIAMSRLPNDPQQAWLDVQKALALDANSYLALRNGAAILSDYLNRVDDAIKMLDRILKQRSQDAEILASRGVLLARNEKFEAARLDAQAALQIQQDTMTKLHVACIYSLCAGNEKNSQLQQQDQTQAAHLLLAALQEQPALVRIVISDGDLEYVRRTGQVRNVIDLADQLLRMELPSDAAKTMATSAPLDSN
ncbi:MAG: protein kinase [Pirellulaceae bacterium]